MSSAIPEGKTATLRDGRCFFRENFQTAVSQVVGNLADVFQSDVDKAWNLAKSVTVE
ncbi:hypothetical protein VSR69_25790 [Paraburkholderia phytofirmans]